MFPFNSFSRVFIVAGVVPDMQQSQVCWCSTPVMDLIGILSVIWGHHGGQACRTLVRVPLSSNRILWCCFSRFWDSEFGENDKFLLRGLSSGCEGETCGSTAFFSGGPGIKFSMLLLLGVLKGPDGGGSKIDGGIKCGGSEDPWTWGCMAEATWFRAFCKVLCVIGCGCNCGSHGKLKWLKWLLVVTTALGSAESFRSLSLPIYSSYSRRLLIGLEVLKWVFLELRRGVVRRVSISLELVFSYFGWPHHICWRWGSLYCKAVVPKSQFSWNV